MNLITVILLVLGKKKKNNLQMSKTAKLLIIAWTLTNALG